MRLHHGRSIGTGSLCCRRVQLCPIRLAIAQCLVILQFLIGEVVHPGVGIVLGVVGGVRQDAGRLKAQVQRADPPVDHRPLGGIPGIGLGPRTPLITRHGVNDAAVLDQALELGVFVQEEGEDGRVGVDHDGGHTDAVAGRQPLRRGPSLAGREVRLLRTDGLRAMGHGGEV
jgi:hypothetical protein